MYKTLQKLDWPAIEQEILDFWDKEKVFEKSIDNRNQGTPFVFYEGPPSANGMPGIHHVMSRAIKDIFCRYKTLQGFLVNRKAGWDTHGLPVELQVEKRLGIKKDDIGHSISVENYNKECKTDVLMYQDKWNELTHRIGFWVDLNNPYITYNNDYIETLWWILKQLYSKNYLYQGLSIQPYSPAAGTGLSSHELNQPGTYKNLKDTTVVAQFKVANTENEYFLAWTTTPWTLPSNTALAVGSKITYVKIASFNPYTAAPIEVILAKDLLGKYFSAENENLPLENFTAGDKILPWKKLAEMTGKELEGIRYEQLLPYAQPADGDAFKVVCADFVSTEDGTGIVHLAPSFGSDDFKAAKLNGIGSLTLVDKKGKFTAEVSDFAFEYVKEQYLTEEEKAQEAKKQGRDKYLTVDERIAIKLKQENKAFKVEKYEHSYPHCWRTDKPILYYPLDSWFIKTTAVKQRMIELNKTINWKPAETGEGRFGNWLENLVDWNLSRSRYWGTPLPIWKTEDRSETKCIGSIEELKAEIHKANKVLGLNQDAEKLSIDLHRPFVDEVVLVSETGNKMVRETDLIDVWFDSGAMPYAQIHYPFSSSETELNAAFPADYIAEGVDQTRGWFFTLHAISVLLFDTIAYKNVIANGLVLDKNGNKMSKRLGNTVDPFQTVAKYGADALRWYMVTNAPPWDNLKFDVNGIEESQRKFFGTLYNTYSFFAIYANIDQYVYSTHTALVLSQRAELDQWIVSQMNTLVLQFQQAMDNYDPTTAGRLVEEFVCENLSNWYVRLSRKRFWRGEMNEDKKAAYDTLFECLNTVSLLASSIAPFFADWLFMSLHPNQNKTSVHVQDYPVFQSAHVNTELEKAMNLAQKITSLALALRKKENLKVRQPLQKIMVPALNEAYAQQLFSVKDIILGELNIKELEILAANNELIVKKVKPNFKQLGPKLGNDIKMLNLELNNFTQKQIKNLELQGSIDVQINNTQYNILLSEVEILAADMPGWLVASEGGNTVALDITLTPELLAEGMSREFINRLQNVRKDSGLEVIDKVSVTCSSTKQMQENLEKYKAYICTEILATELLFTDQLDEAVEIEVYEEILRVRIAKA